MNKIFDICYTGESASVLSKNILAFDFKGKNCLLYYIIIHSISQASSVFQSQFTLVHLLS